MYMKKGKWIILLTMCCFLLLGCSSNTSGKLESITFEEYQTLIENKETFALEMWRTTCTHCQSKYEKNSGNRCNPYDLLLSRRRRKKRYDQNQWGRIL